MTHDRNAIPSRAAWKAHGGLTGTPPDSWPTEHEAGCIYGGSTCGYWMVIVGCTEEHWERHYTGTDEHCPCGTHFPGARAFAAVVFDATEKP